MSCWYNTLILSGKLIIQHSKLFTQRMITYLIIGFTCALSVWAFSNHDVFLKCKHWPYYEARRGEYYRWLTAGFIHADYMHLAFNMITLYSFGGIVEQLFVAMFPMGKSLYLIFYLLGIVFAGAPTFFKHRNNSAFASIGASGAVSAVLFAGILFMPTMKLNMFFIPIPISGWFFGLAYLAYSWWASNQSRDNIDHDAHFFGALFGFTFPLLLEPGLLPRFFEQLL